MYLVNMQIIEAEFIGNKKTRLIFSSILFEISLQQWPSWSHFISAVWKLLVNILLRYLRNKRELRHQSILETKTFYPCKFLLSSQKEPKNIFQCTTELFIYFIGLYFRSALLIVKQGPGLHCTKNECLAFLSVSLENNKISFIARYICWIRRVKISKLTNDSYSTCIILPFSNLTFWQI